ncbi:MAG: CRISPR-associated endonuclease Cas2 [Vampirovibrio sp.]|nr:CRISPR-associated endonuclease Cas2 [Vampirovibrio sp.]
MGWLLVMFDLPVVEDSDRKAAARFRKDLLNLGFEMMQESVYTRYAVSIEKLDQHTARVKRIAPERGNITCLFVTEKQWCNSVNIRNWSYIRTKQSRAGEEAIAQLTFW